MRLKIYITAIVLLTSLSSRLFAQQIKYLIPPTNNYTSLSNFSEGLARLAFAYDSIGFINLSGERAFPQIFEDAGTFHCDRAYVRKRIRGEYKYGFINAKGRLIIPYVYDEVEDFSCNRAAVNKDGVWTIVNKDGKAIIGDSLLITETEIIDNAEKTKRWEDTEPPKFVHNLLLTRQGEKYGYADTSGKIVIPFQYLEAGDFSDGVAIVANKKIEQPKLRGDDVLTKMYNSLPDDRTTYHWLVIDTKGNILFNIPDSINIDVLNGFSNGLAAFFTGNGSDIHYGEINKKGQIIFEPQFYREPMAFSDGLSFVRVDGNSEDNGDAHLLTLDTIGKIIAKIPLGEKTSSIYDAKSTFHEGLLAVEINNLWGYMDKLGKIIIEPQFNEALSFSEGFAVVVTKDGKAAIIKNPLVHKNLFLNN